MDTERDNCVATKIIKQPYLVLFEQVFDVVVCNQLGNDYRIMKGIKIMKRYEGQESTEWEVGTHLLSKFGGNLIAKLMDLTETSLRHNSIISRPLSRRIYVTNPLSFTYLI